MKSKQPMPRVEEVMGSGVNPSPQELGEKSRPDLLQQRETLENSPLPRFSLLKKPCGNRLNTVFRRLRGMAPGEMVYTLSPPEESNTPQLLRRLEAISTELDPARRAKTTDS